LLAIDDEIAKINEKIGELKNEIKTFKQKQEELRKKIDDSRSYNEKDSKIQKIIAQLKEFIKRFKEDKKNSLEKGILSGLTTLLHKKGFIQKVLVDISHSGEDVDINLYGERNDKIDKGSLSMGESQMYASALLNALVDESDIEFPVFIDSPMQKFDKDHAENIIQEFYPSVSNQVIIFPLIHKELTINEFDLLKDNVNKAYLINNINSDSSQFLETEPKDLFQTYNQIYS
jgi:DNA sulfur modification protein DndD